MATSLRFLLDEIMNEGVFISEDFCLRHSYNFWYNIILKHPQEWIHSGYNEIQNPRRRYSLIDHKKLMKLLNFSEYELLTKTHSQWIENEINQSKNIREKKWTEAVAVGDNDFVEKTSKYLDERNKKHADTTNIDTYHLKEDQATYNCLNHSSFENTHRSTSFGILLIGL